MRMLPIALHMGVIEIVVLVGLVWMLVLGFAAALCNAAAHADRVIVEDIVAPPVAKRRFRSTA